MTDKYIQGVVSSFNIETFKARPILNYLNTHYKNVRTRSAKLSTLKHTLLKNIKIGNETGKEYHDRMRKEYKNPVQIPDEIMKLKLDKQETTKIINDNMKKLEEKQEKIVIRHDILESILDGIQGESFDELFPALLLASGRRTVEILSRGSFRKSANNVKFSGQVKKGVDSKPYKIPISIDTNMFLKGFKKFRKIVDTKGLTNIEIQKKYSSKIQNLFIRLSKTYGIKLNPHMLRAIYLEEQYKDPTNTLTKNGLALKILGHDSLSTSLHYVNICII